METKAREKAILHHFPPKFVIWNPFEAHNAAPEGPQWALSVLLTLVLVTGISLNAKMFS